MIYGQCKTPIEHLLYNAECTLATIEYHAGLSRPNQQELKRQLAMADKQLQALEWFAANQCEYTTAMDKKIIGDHLPVFQKQLRVMLEATRDNFVATGI